MEKFLRKLNRILGYLLMPLFIVLMITGYRQVGYFTFFTRGIANLLHQVYINISFLVMVTMHAGLSIRFALARNRIKGRSVDLLLLLCGLIFIIGFTYFALS
ncbi:MAG: hypothetical protein K9H14_06470 [Actinomycetia bacterium]|nr:hypothetical protein [Actinomycetes bacterium]